MANPAVFNGDGQIGVVGTSNTNIGVHGRCFGNSTGVFGLSAGAIGVHGQSTTSTGVFGLSDSGWGVHGASTWHLGVHGYSERDTGVWGLSRDHFGVHGQGGTHGVWAEGANGLVARANTGFGVAADSPLCGVSASAGHASGTGGAVGVQAATNDADGTAVLASAIFGGRAGYFHGPVTVNGNLTVTNGNKPFKIDHPLDPQNKYLLHNAVESSERKNVYDGVVHLDEDGAGWVDLPEWFEALNEDFRYQLTTVGGAAPNLHVAEEIYENRFRIAGGEGGMKVCWQVTGSRKDPWAAANPFEVEEEKPPEERGRYLQPALYNAPEEQRVRIGPLDEETLRQMREESLPPRAPQMPSGYEPPPYEPPPQATETPPRVVSEIAELREQIEEMKRVRAEDEQRRQIDELKRQIEELRRQQR